MNRSTKRFIYIYIYIYIYVCVCVCVCVCVKRYQCWSRSNRAVRKMISCKPQLIFYYCYRLLPL